MVATTTTGGGSRSYRLVGIDVGGTFTDLVFVDTTEESIRIVKLPASAVYAALAQAVPERCVATFAFSCGVMTIGGEVRGRSFVFFWFSGAGYGGYEGGDGLSYGSSAVGWSKSTPVEILEQSQPVLIRRYELRPDSGGPGAWRGGLGATVEVELLDGEGLCSVLSDNGDLPAGGTEGGAPGATTIVRFHRSTGETFAAPLHTHASGVAMGARDRIEMHCPGGGGWGDPLARPLEAVERDVRAGYVTAVAAREQYGVVVTDGTVDREATEAQRESRTPRIGLPSA